MPGDVVVDASLAVKWVITEPYSPEAIELLAGWVADAVDVGAPPLFAYEVANALHRRAIDGTIPVGTVDASLDEVCRSVRFHNLDLALVKRAVAIATETGRRAAYDAQYIALAESLGCELWTADERLWNAVRSRFPFVRWVGAR
jgi:predicted nucleic acid-binding protein